MFVTEDMRLAHARQTKALPWTWCVIFFSCSTIDLLYYISFPYTCLLHIRLAKEMGPYYDDMIHPNTRRNSMFFPFWILSSFFSALVFSFFAKAKATQLFFSVRLFLILYVTNWMHSYQSFSIAFDECSSFAFDIRFFSANECRVFFYVDDDLCRWQISKYFPRRTFTENLFLHSSSFQMVTKQIHDRQKRFIPEWFILFLSISFASPLSTVSTVCMFSSLSSSFINSRRSYRYWISMKETWADTITSSKVIFSRYSTTYFRFNQGKSTMRLM